MKKTLIAVACLIGSLSTFGQGYLAFANLGAGVNSPFHTDTGAVLAGSGYSVEMLVGATSATAIDSLTPLFTGNFASGFFNGGSRTVPAADIDGTGKTWVVIRAWANAGGSITSYAAAVAAGQLTGVTTAFQVTPQVSSQVPANPLTGMPLINGNGNLSTPVPEPSVLALGALGIAALFVRRRK